MGKRIEVAQGAPVGNPSRRQAGRSARTALLLCSSLPALLLTAPADAGTVLPSGGQVVAGQASIASAPKGVTINQASGHAVINWQNFSIGAGGTVQFNNGSGATLNRVTGGNLSQIDGVLNATGSVYLINPQGVVVGKGGKVITGGSFVASTRDVDSDDFMKGGALHAKGTSNGDVVNQGSISSRYGDTILIGKSVSNSGTISAPNGTAGLAAGDDVLLRPMDGDARISISAGKGNVTNTGVVAAAQAELNAAGGNVYAVAASGSSVKALGTSTINGHVWLTAGGTASVTGSVSASNADGSGGTVTVRAQDINAAGHIDASATKAGAAGGTISVIATGTTTVSGTLAAKGGQGGVGGFVETSGEHLHVADSAQIATDAPDGSNGTWLIDPSDFTIAASGGDITGATLSSQLASNDVTILSSDGTVNTSGNGDIFVNDAVSWTSSHVLTLTADRNINVNAGITLSGGGLTLNATSGAINIYSTMSVTGAGVVNLNPGSFTPSGLGTSLANMTFYNGASLDFGATNHGATLSINGNAYTLLYSYTDMRNNLNSTSGKFALATSISGGTYSNSYFYMYSGSVFEGLGHVMDGGTFNYSGGVPTGLFGEMDGTLRDFAITNATINGGGSGGGSIAGTSWGTIANVYFTGTITDSSSAYVGGLVGSKYGGNIYNSWTNATVTGGGGGGVGGLIGRSVTDYGDLYVVNSYALGSVTGGRNVGGLLGLGGGEFTNVYATGNVKSTGSSSSVGGLIGEYDSGTITGAYATGNVSGGDSDGGLVGYALGSIKQAYATGDVVGNGASSGSVGGLVGSTYGYSTTFDQVAAYGSVSNGYYAGGLVGKLYGGVGITNAFAAGSATGSSGAYAVGGLIGYIDGGGIPGQNLAEALSIGAVSGGSYRGGSIGYMVYENLADVFFDTGTAGITTNVGSAPGTSNVTGMTTSVLQNGSLPGSFSSSFWGAQSGAYAYLKTFFPSGVQVLGGTAVNATGASIAVADNGYRQGKGSVGANGVFYIAMQPGSITTGDTIVLYNSMVNPGGIIETAPATLTNLSYTGGILIASTSATSATAADAGITAQAASILTHDAQGAAVLASVTDHGYIASGASFDLNESFTGPVYVQTTTASAPLTVSGTITATGAVTLSTSGTLTINAPITASGKVTVALSTGTDAYSMADLVFGASGKLDFGSTNQSSTLTVNGTSYSLLYTMANLVSTAGSGTFALATTVTGGSYTNSVVSALNAGAIFEGLGNTITGLSITNNALAANGNLGLFGTNNGTIRDLKLVNETVTGKSPNNTSYIGGLAGTNNNLIIYSSTSGTISSDPGATVGGLVGYNTGSNARVVSDSSAAAISISGSSTFPYGVIGGLVGNNYLSAQILNSWATGSVTGGTGTSNTAGGLAGSNYNTISGSHATGAVSAGGYAGGLVGSSQGAVSGSYATGSVSLSNTSGYYAGGLIGSTNSTVTNSYATGNVTGASVYGGSSTGGLVGYLYAYSGTVGVSGSYATGAVSTGNYVGGLIGQTYATSGTITVSGSYATGSVSDYTSGRYTSGGGLIGQASSHTSVSGSFATGNVTLADGWGAGGLIGYTTGSATSISDSYAMGSVQSLDAATYLGGLVGQSSGGTITTSFATGAVGSGNYRGGLYGTGSATVTSSYFDTATTGVSVQNYGGAANPASALSTASFQNGSLPSGFSSSTWSTGSGLYPYITSFFPGGVQSVSGTMTGGSGSAVSLYVAGTAVGNASVGANGYFYFAVPTGIISGSGSVALITHGSDTALLANITGQTSGLSMSNFGELSYTTASTSYASSYGADRATLLSYASTPSFVAGMETVLTATGASFAVDTSVNLSNSLSILGGHAITTTGAISGTGTLSLYAQGDLTIGNTISLAVIDLRSNGNVTLNSALTSSGATTVTTYGGNFINNVGSSAITAAGNWTITSYAPDNDVFGDLDSGHVAMWGGASAPSGGNYYIFTQARTATVSVNTGVTASKTYGDGFTYDSSYLSASGLSTGVSHAFLGDTLASIFSTLPTFSSSGLAATANVGSYDVTLSGGTAGTGYTIVLDNTTPGTLSVTQRALTITGDAYSRYYGDTNAGTITAAGDDLVNGDTISTVAITSPTATATSDVGTYAYTAGSAVFSSGSASNYAITYANSALNVTARPVTVTADGLTKTYGDANPTLTYTSTSLGAGAALSGDLATIADATTDVGSYAITAGTLTTANNPNYVVTYQGANLDIGTRAVTVTADAQSRHYGDANPTLTYTSTSLGSGVALSGDLATSADVTSNVSTYAITAGTLTTANNPNYVVTYVGADLDVTARPITLTGDLITRHYGDDNPSTYTGSVTTGSLVNGDTISAIDVISPTASATDNVGTGYSYTAGNAVFSSGLASNYSITYADGALHVTARPVTVTADAQSRHYGDSNPTLTYTTTSLGAGAALLGDLDTTADSTSSVNAYGITAGTVTTANNPNYVVTYVGADLSVTARPITITGDVITRDYGDANPTGSTGTVTTGDLVNGDTISGIDVVSATATATSNAGTGYSYTGGNAAFSSGAASNYSITYADGALHIDPRAVTVTADALSKSYGDANPTLTFTTSNLGAGAALTGSLATVATATSDVGTYAITAGTVTTANNPNYVVSYVGDDLTIGTRAITVTADAKSKSYGDANPALTYTTSSLGAGAALSGALTVSADQTTGVGSYAIGQGTVDNAHNTNYDITYTGANLDVIARAITLTADDKTKIYGEANPALTVTVGGLGLVNGDTLTGAVTTSADGTSGVGNVAITQGTLAASSNYDVTFVSGALSITARPITITADDKTRTYGDANPTLTQTISGLGLVNGDSLSGALATSAVASSDVGSYAIGQGTLAASSNYAVTFNPGALSIGARAITVTADALSKTYGDANPTLSFTTSSLGAGAALTGSLAVAADATTGVGTYAITQGSVDSAHNGNYTITYAGADLTIGTRAITLTADAKTKVYGDANPALTVTVGGLGLVNGDTLSGALTTAADATSGVGSYAITQGTLAASSNYAVSFTAGSLSVTARPITVTADALTRDYGAANPGLSYSVSNLVNGDSLSGALATTATASSNVGSYAVTQGSLAASSNYTVSFTPGSLTINPVALTITAGNASKTYGDALNLASVSFTASGLVNGDAVTSVSLTSAGAAATASVASSPYTILVGNAAGTGLSNYTITYNNGQLTVTPHSLTVTANSLSRTYGASNPALTYVVSGLVNGDTLAGALATSAVTTSGVGRYTVLQGTLSAGGNYALVFTPGTLTINAAALTVTADNISAQTLALAKPTATVTGLVAGDGSSVVSGLQFDVEPVTGDSTSYTVTPFGASAANYSISYASGVLTVQPDFPTTFTAPLITSSGSSSQPSPSGTPSPTASGGAPSSGPQPYGNITLPGGDSGSGGGSSGGSGSDGGQGGDGDGKDKSKQAKSQPKSLFKKFAALQ